jgi:serine/threonine protein kinase/WD40 repeat protein
MSEREIFDAALAIAEPAQRSVYLDKACADDPALRAHVSGLLQMHGQLGSFLEGPKPTARTVGEPTSEYPGSLIGQYKLLEQIGEGGFGVVFMAEQHQPMRRKVALKVLKPGMDTRQVIARFEAERQALALMDHPNIAQVFDGGETASGRPYFVMELVRGIPITDFCDQNHLPVRDRLELFTSVCQAVQHAHQKGVIHRDLKPSNVMVTMHDNVPVVKVIDFGVAKAMGQQLTEKTLFTNFAQMIGTPVYMSPEQAQMSGLDMDTRTDVYSLGVVLYELLTGTTPFDKERLGTAAYDEMRRIIREEEPATPSTRLSELSRPHAPREASVTRSVTSTLASISAHRRIEPANLTKLLRGELDWIVMKALEKDRNRRYESASALAADVQRHLNDQTVLARPQTLGYRLGKLARRHKGPVSAAALVALSLVVAIIGTTWGLIRAKHAQAVAVNEAAQKEDALEQKEIALGAAQESEREKTEQLWHSLVAQARANRLSRRPGQRFECLGILQRATELARTLDLPAENFHELRNAVIATLALPDLYLAGPWNPWPADAYNVDFDEAHTLYARTDRQGNCSIRRVADDTELHLLPGLGVPASPVLSRDGKFLAVRHFTEGPERAGVAVLLWQLDGARTIRSEEKVHHVDFHPGGRQIALAYDDGAIGLFELPSGRQLSRLAPDTLNREVTIALHPTEPLVAVCSYFARVLQIRDVRTGEIVASFAQPSGPTEAVWHPDGHTLAVAYGAEHIRLYDRTTLQSYRTLQTAGGGAYLTFNHAGDRLATAGWSTGLELFDVGTGQKLFGTLPGLIRRFSGDDRRLAGGTQDGKLGIWQVADGREYRTLVRKAVLEKAARSPTVSLDGRLLAASTSDGLGLWDLTTGSELVFVPMADMRGSYNRVLFEPSGALLTMSLAGVFRWPLRTESSVASESVLGPPERLPLPRGSALGQSGDGRVIVTCARAVVAEQAYAGGWILQTDRPGQPLRIDAGADIGDIVVSPDGRWVVTVTHEVGLAKIWDARDGRLVKQLADWGTGYYPRFSPDGRWLSTSVDGGRLFAVDTWEPGPQIGGRGEFSPDGTLMAVGTTNGVIRLIDPATGREFAALEHPLNRCSQPIFTPDGTKLIGLSSGSDNGLCVWDLRLIRQQLKDLELDWDRPEFPPIEPGSLPAQPLKVEVRLGDPVKLAVAREDKARQAIEQYRRAVEANPDSADACNSLAWVYLTTPESLRDVEAALPLAEKAVRLAATARDLAMSRNTLGVAYYRAGRYREAVEILRTNLATQEDWGLAFDLYFLAMSQHHLGEPERARDYYEWAIRWTTTQKNLSAGHVEELTIIRAEAEQVLRVEE